MLSYTFLHLQHLSSAGMKNSFRDCVSLEERLAAAKLNQPPVNRTENNTARRVEGNTVFRFRLVGIAFKAELLLESVR